MDIEKGRNTVTGGTVRMAVGISKVDQERRIVSGFATMDNLDSQSDIVDTEASLRAFAAWRKNLREMHMPVAVGRVVDFTADEFYDTKSNKVYSGVWVDAYVSRGAQDTWEKVLDGTLTGFSIGGNVLDSITKYDPTTEQTVRVITDYELIELSLVDNPANQLANIFAVQKNADGTFVKGMVAEAKTTNVFYCETDEIGKTSTEDTLDCHCGAVMKRIGWFEYDSADDKTEKFATTVNSYRTTNNQQTVEKSASDEGGVDVADTAKEETVETEPVEVKEETVVETSETTVEPVEEEEASEVSEEATDAETAEADKAAEDVSEVEDASTEIEKMFKSLKDDIAEQLSKNHSQFESNLGEVSEKMDEFSKQATDLNAKYEELNTRFTSVLTQIEEVEKSVSALDGASAVKKSGDLGGSAGVEKSTKATKPFWGGSILGD